MAADDDAAQITAPPKAVATAKSFAQQHGGSARAVVENIGNAGARIVLIGEDGALGDVLVTDVATGDAVVAAAELTASEWDGETTAALQIGPEHRRKMAGPRAE